MRILATTFAFNERPYLPEWVRYYQNAGCEIMVLDNYSTDGTYEWLRDHKIRTGRIDTNETFNLKVLQAVLVNEIIKMKPDWVIYGGIDLYHSFPDDIHNTMKKADKGGYNVIEVQHFEAFNTGEEVKYPLTSNFFYMRKHGRLRTIGKMVKGFNIVADDVTNHNPKVYSSEGILVNYGMCKPKEARELTFARRKKAWAEGMHRGWGTHYEPASKAQWIWDKNTLRDLRTLPEYELIKKTQV